MEYQIRLSNVAKAIDKLRKQKNKKIGNSIQSVPLIKDMMSSVLKNLSNS